MSPNRVCSAERRAMARDLHLPAGRAGALLALTGAALLAMTLPGVCQAGPSLCSAGEVTLFGCGLGQKRVAVCGSPDISAERGRLQYRFGRPGSLELVYPPADADWRAVTRGGVLAFSGGGGAYLAFTNGPYRYVVYTAIGRGWGTKAGVVVEKGGRRVASLPCKDQEVSELGPDLFARAGVVEDAEMFDLP